jgi:hypothetical protein
MLGLEQSWIADHHRVHRLRHPDRRYEPRRHAQNHDFAIHRQLRYDLRLNLGQF